MAPATAPLEIATRRERSAASRSISAESSVAESGAVARTWSGRSSSSARSMIPSKRRRHRDGHPHARLLDDAPKNDPVTMMPSAPVEALYLIRRSIRDASSGSSAVS